MRRATGFTLIEVLIVVGIIGFLAAIALPAYTNYVQRSKIAEAVANLSDMRVKLEQHFLDNRTYENACEDKSIAPKPKGENAKYFTYECALAATTFLVTATAKDPSLKDLVLTINEKNERKTVGVPAGWKMPTSNCWVRKQDGTC